MEGSTNPQIGDKAIYLSIPLGNIFLCIVRCELLFALLLDLFSLSEQMKDKASV